MPDGTLKLPSGSGGLKMPDMKMPSFGMSAPKFELPEGSMVRMHSWHAWLDGRMAAGASTA